MQNGSWKADLKGNLSRLGLGDFLQRSCLRLGSPQATLTAARPRNSPLPWSSRLSITCLSTDMIDAPGLVEFAGNSSVVRVCSEAIDARYEGFDISNQAKYVLLLQG